MGIFKKINDTLVRLPDKSDVAGFRLYTDKQVLRIKSSTGKDVDIPIGKEEDIFSTLKELARSYEIWRNLE